MTSADVFLYNCANLNVFMSLRVFYFVSFHVLESALRSRDGINKKIFCIFGRMFEKIFYLFLCVAVASLTLVSVYVYLNLCIFLCLYNLPLRIIFTIFKESERVRNLFTFRKYEKW